MPLILSSLVSTFTPCSIIYINTNINKYFVTFLSYMLSIIFIFSTCTIHFLWLQNIFLHQIQPDSFYWCHSLRDSDFFLSTVFCFELTVKKQVLLSSPGQRSCELLSSLGVCCLSLNFYILTNFSDTTSPNLIKLDRKHLYTWRLLILSWSINKHVRHGQFMFLIGWNI